MAAVGVAAFLAAHKDASQLESGKVLCKTTGHELLPQLELLQAHWGGKTYQKKVQPRRIVPTAGMCCLHDRTARALPSQTV